MDASQVNGLFSVEFSLSRQCHFCSCRVWSRPTTDCRLKSKDGLPLTTFGDDEEAKMDPRRLPAGMTAEGRRVGVVWFGHRSFAGPQDDNLAPTTYGDDGAERMDPR